MSNGSASPARRNRLSRGRPLRRGGAAPPVRAHGGRCPPYWQEFAVRHASEDANRVGVIGGGLGGLAAACTLAARGYRVVVFEKSPWLGGKAAVLDAAGFRFDMGPTILTMPSVLRRL